MIVKIMSNGKSFSGLATYLTHDPDRAPTADRVVWTHTLNLANDDVPCAANEMVWTARDAELLKQEAGIRAGGRATENTVKHFSLNWAPTEHPSQEHMIESAQDFLRHMKYGDHQGIFISHQDKHPHLHIMLNAVHPETGLRLDDSFERRRAQEWALQYEREHGIYCEQRLLDPEERERNPPRNVWMEFWVNQREFEKAEKSLQEDEPNFAEDAKNRENEWRILKEYQCSERTNFFAEGKAEFKELRNSIYREIREEFRGRWAEYYAAAKNGDAEELAQLKAQIVDDQKSILDARRDEACQELRESRDERYRVLLDDQRELRAHLRWSQEAGTDNLPMLLSLSEREATQDISTAFRDAAAETTRPAGDAANERIMPGSENDVSPGTSEGAGVAGCGFSAFAAFDSLLSIFEGPRPALRRGPVDAGSFQSAADEALKRERAREDDEERDKHRAFYGEL